jgi:uncharacterized DUF497 family protein
MPTKAFDWNKEKNETLKKVRGVSFEEIVGVLNREGPIATYEHPNQQKHPGQKVYIVDVNGAIFVVPFLESEGTIFLKTLFPSRKAARRYQKQER